jgi:hypothetical protein
MTLAKKDMIATLQANYDNWEAVYELFNGKITADNQVPNVHGWYRGFDGLSIDEMYLVNVHPCSDESGVCINSGIFKKLKQVKPVVAGYMRVEINGKRNMALYAWCKHHALMIAETDLEKFGVKSKFRPVYAKSEGKV